MLAGAGGPGALLTSSQTGKTVPKREIPTSAVRGRERGGILNFRGEMLFAGAGGPGALQTSSDGRRRYRSGNFRLLRGADGRGGEMHNFRKNLMLVGAGGPGALQTSSDGGKTALRREFPTSAVRGRERGGILNFRREMLLAGTGGPGALQTSSPARSLGRVDTDPHAALRALHCRAAPGNSSIAGAAPLDSVRLRRNCSLLLCETQSSSLTCARGADRACAREKAKYRGNSARGADRA